MVACFYILASFPLLQNEYPFDPTSVFNPYKPMITFKKLFSISSFLIFCFSIFFFFFSFLLRSLLLNILSSVHLRGQFFKFLRKLILYKIVNYRDEMRTVFSRIFFIRIDLNNIIQRRDRDGFLRIRIYLECNLLKSLLLQKQFIPF